MWHSLWREKATIWECCLCRNLNTTAFLYQFNLTLLFLLQKPLKIQSVVFSCFLKICLKVVFFLSAFRRSFRSEARGCEEILSLTTVYQQQPRCCRTFSSLFINPLPPFTIIIIMIIRPFPSPLVCLSTAGAVGVPHNPSVLQRDPGLSSRLSFFTLEERRQVQGFSSLQLFVGQCDRSAGYSADISLLLFSVGRTELPEIIVSISTSILDLHHRYQTGYFLLSYTSGSVDLAETSSGLSKDIKEWKHSTYWPREHRLLCRWSPRRSSRRRMVHGPITHYELTWSSIFSANQDVSSGSFWSVRKEHTWLKKRTYLH